MRADGLKRTVLSAMFLSIGLILPFFTMQIKEMGDSLLPMHIPVMLCGLLCGAKYGLAIGFILPILRGVLFSMPPVFPNAVWMAFELAAYGFVIGLIYSRSKKSTKSVYIALIAAMISGRIVWGVAKAVLLGIGGKSFGIAAFIAGGFTDAVPGIILQLVLIPSVMALCRMRNNDKKGSIK